MNNKRFEINLKYRNRAESFRFIEGELDIFFFLLLFAAIFFNSFFKSSIRF